LENLALFGGRTLSFGPSSPASGRTLIMGILNINDDSFYPDSRVRGAEAAALRALQMARCGADIIDIGAESTRPGSSGLDEGIELENLIPAIRAVREALPDMPISADTRKYAAASASIEAGADIVNDVSGLGLRDERERMLRLLAESGAAYVLTHPGEGRWEPSERSGKGDIMGGLLSFFSEKIEMIGDAGVDRDRIIIDPGIGFGKRIEDNLEIMANIGELKRFGLPILVGASRKSFIGHVLELPDPADRVEGTLAISALCADRGVEIVRVHDVLENRRAVLMAGAVRRRSS
jgi:dihydropteroate synthase